MKVGGRQVEVALALGTGRLVLGGTDRGRLPSSRLSGGGLVVPQRRGTRASSEPSRR